MNEHFEKEAIWPGPEGMIPALPKNAGNAAWHTRHFLDEILIEMRILGTDEADLTFELFGERFASPIMMPAFSHLNKVGADKADEKPMQAYARAAKELNLVNWVGMEPDEEFLDILAVGAKTIRIIKPFADKEEIERQIRSSAHAGAFAVGVDIDHSIGSDGRFDVVDGIAMGPISERDLKGFVELAHEYHMPFVAKGVLSATDAAVCEKAGTDAIVVSHHHGRMPFAVPPLMVLPEIKKVSGRMKVFVDCSMDDGRDAYKALAMGADAISVGRGILPALLKSGTAGVKEKVGRMNEELAELMGYTGVKTLADFDADVLWYHGARLAHR